MIDTQACLSRTPHVAIDLSKWQRTVDLMSELFKSACGTIVQFRQNEFNAVVASKNPDNFIERDSSWPWDMHSFCRHIIETGRGLYVPDPETDPQWKSAEPVACGPVRSYYGLPIFWPDGTLFGTICVIDITSTDYPHTLRKVLEQFKELIDADLKMLVQYEEIKSMALTDELSGLNNRRGFTLLAEQRCKDAPRLQKDIGVIFLDIDNMKQINDDYGHSCGDECIRLVSRVITEHCRESDITGRVGGDEFLIMQLIDSPIDIEQFCERLCREFEVLSQRCCEAGKTSISCGFAIRRQTDTLSVAEMIAEADRKMYQTKQERKKDGQLTQQNQE